MLLIAPLFYGTIKGSTFSDSCSWLILPPLAVFLVSQLPGVAIGKLGTIFAIWLSYLAIQIPFSEYPYLSSVETLQFSCWVSIFVIAYLAASSGIAVQLAKIIALAGLLPSLWGLFLHLGHEPGDPFYTGLVGTFGLHNPFAGFLLMTIPMTLYALYADREKKYMRLLWAATALIQVAAFILTRSRAAWLVALIVLLIFLLTPVFKSKFGRILKITIGIVSGVIVVIAVFSLIPPEWLFEKYRSKFELLDYSIKGRYEFWRAALRMLFENPLFGTGAGTFQTSYTRFQQSIVFYATDPHSYPLHVAAGQGIVGFGFLIAVICFIWRSFNLWLLRDSSGLARASALAATGIFLHSAVDFDLTYAPNAFALVSLAAMAAFFGAGKMSAGESTSSSSNRIGLSSATLLITSLSLAWGLCTVYAKTPWVYQESRIKDWQPSTFSLKTPFPSIALLERKFEEIVAAKADSDSDSIDYEFLSYNLSRFTEKYPKVASAWQLRAAFAAYKFGNHSDAIEFSRKAIDLDPYNFPEYYFFLAGALEAAGKENEAYALMRECLMVKIPIVEPVYPEHVKPTWQAKNLLFAGMWKKLSDYELKFGKKELAEEFEKRAEAFYDYVKKHGDGRS